MTTVLSMPKRDSFDMPEALPKARVARVFDRLSGQLGTKMAALYDGVPPAVVQAEWAAGLACFHVSEIERGIKACSERSFAPVLGEFLRMCRPALDPEWAFYEAADGLRQRDAGEFGKWSHPAVWRAAGRMSMEVHAGDWKAHRARWTYTLRAEFDVGWSDIPAPAVRIENTAKVGGPPTAELRAKLAEMRALFKSDRSGL